MSFMANCLSRRDQNVYSIFQNHAPRGTKIFQKIPKWKKVFIKMCWLPTVITNSFRIPVVQKFENIFSHIFSFPFALGFILFLLVSTKFMMTKNVQNKVYSFHANVDIKVKFTFLKKCIRKWKHPWSKDKQKLPLVDPFVLMLLVTVDKSSKFD